MRIVATKLLSDGTPSAALSSQKVVTGFKSITVALSREVDNWRDGSDCSIAVFYGVREEGDPDFRFVHPHESHIGNQVRK